MNTPNFTCDPADHPADMLDNARAVLCFLTETAGGFHGESLDSLGLTRRGCRGLTIILQGVENTVKDAAEKL